MRLGKSRKPRKPSVPKAYKAKFLKYSVDCSIPVSDSVLDPANFEKFLHDNMKLVGKNRPQSDKAEIVRKGDRITVIVKPPFSKRYLKFLTKKYLKKQSLRDYLRVIASDKKTFIMKYYSITDDTAEEKEECCNMTLDAARI